MENKRRIYTGGDTPVVWNLRKGYCEVGKTYRFDLPATRFGDAAGIE
jgi:hypothetical protein